MKEFFKRIATYGNFFGLGYIILYFSYIGINMYRNKGDYFINIILLVLTCIYLLLYVYSVFIEENKKIRKRSKKFFTKSKKVVGFINAVMIFTSLFSNDTNSFFTIFFALATVCWYLFYFFIDIASSLALHEFKKFKKGFGWKNDNRD